MASIDQGDTEECVCQLKVGVTGIETGMAAIYIFSGMIGMAATSLLLFCACGDDANIC